MPKANREVVYRKIPSLKFLYEISEDGRYVRNVKSKKVLQQLDRKGYYTIHTIVNGDQHPFVHRLVAECWLGPCPEGLQIDHIDRNKHNNHYSNLRYVTSSENNLNKDWTDARATALHNARMVQAKSVLVNNIRFESYADAAKYIAENTGKNWRTICNRISKHRHFIHGYTISYCRDCTL